MCVHVARAGGRDGPGGGPSAAAVPLHHRPARPDRHRRHALPAGRRGRAGGRAGQLPPVAARDAVLPAAAPHRAGRAGSVQVGARGGGTHASTPPPTPFTCPSHALATSHQPPATSHLGSPLAPHPTPCCPAAGRWRTFQSPSWTRAWRRARRWRCCSGARGTASSCASWRVRHGGAAVATHARTEHVGQDNLQDTVAVREIDSTDLARPFSNPCAGRTRPR
jgi:hypothetical protein